MATRGTRRYLVVLGAAALTAALVGCSGWGDGLPTGSETLPAGEARHALDLDRLPRDGETTGELRLPYGDLRVTVSAELDEVPGADSRPRDLVPPEGLAIVVVSVAPQSRAPLDTVSVPLMFGREDHVVRIVNGDRTIDLPPVVGSTHFVVVDPDRPILAEVELDEVAQRVDVRTGEREIPAVAEPLYADGPDAWPQQSCDLDADIADLRALCWARVSTTPWLPDVGWAEPGRPWWTVALGTSLRGGDADYDAASAEVGATLDDAADLGVTAQRASVTHLAFPAPGGRRSAALALRVTYPDAATAGETVVLTGTTRVQAP